MYIYTYISIYISIQLYIHLAILTIAAQLYFAAAFRLCIYLYR